MEIPSAATGKSMTEALTQPTSAPPDASAVADDLDPYRPPTAGPGPVEEDLWELARRGRRVVAVIIAPWILLQSFTFLRVMLGGIEPAIGMTRLVTTILLCWYLYRGSRTARFLFTGLMVLSLGLVFVALLSLQELQTWQLVALSIMALILVGQIVVLWWLRSVRVFFSRDEPL